MNGKDWKKEALALVVLLRAKCSDEEWANMESRFECTAPAPQPNQLAEALADLLQSMEGFRQGALSPGKLRIAMQKANDLLQPDLDEKNDLDTLRERDQRFDNSEEVKELRELNYRYRLQRLLSKREATPQVTPTEVNFCTGDQDCRHTCELEIEWEADGRWLAEFMRFPGVAAYGHSKEEAIRNAAKVLIESEQASPTPDKCPTCGSPSRERRNCKYPIPAHDGDSGYHRYDMTCCTECDDSWHSSAGTPKGNK